MNHRIRLFFCKNVIHGIVIPNVCTVKNNVLPCNLFDALYRLFACIVKVIYNHNLIAFLCKLHAGMTSYIAGSTGH